MSTTNGTWTNTPTSYGYQWQRDGVDIGGATASTYTVVSGDQGHDIRVRVAATNALSLIGYAYSNALSIPESEGTLDPDLPVPFLSLLGAVDAYPIEVDIDVEGGVDDTWDIELDAAETYADVTADPPVLVNAADHIQPVTDDPLDFGLSSRTDPDETFMRCRVRDPINHTYGPWSNIVAHGDVTAPEITSSSSWSITADDELTYQATGSEPGVWSISGGSDADQFSIDASTGEVTLLNTPTRFTQGTYDLKLRLTDYAGLYDELTLAITDDIVWPIPTAPATPADLLTWQTAADLTKMFQTITGTTAVAADGDVVGTWKDSSTAGFDFTAQANNTTRPLYKTSGGINWVEFDGSNDVLLRAQSLGFMTAGNDRTLFMALRPLSPDNDDRFFSQNESSAGWTLFNPIMYGSSGSDLNYFIRNDGGASTKSGTFTGGGLANNTDVVIAITVEDMGGGTWKLTPYKDGVAGTPYTDFFGSSFTWNHVTLGAIYVTFFANWTPMRMHGLLTYNKLLSVGEMAVATSYLGGLQGRTI